MQRMLLLLTLFVFLCCQAKSQHTAPAAGTVFREACKQAGIEKKKVFLIFHASWCGWCHKMDLVMNDPSCKKFFEDNFVIRHLAVQESKEKKALENPGAAEMMASYGGGNSGIPYFLVFDAGGNLLADSKMRTAKDPAGHNMGCPSIEEEINAFSDLLKKTTQLKHTQITVIAARFRAMQH